MKEILLFFQQSSTLTEIHLLTLVCVIILLRLFASDFGVIKCWDSTTVRLIVRWQ